MPRKGRTKLTTNEIEEFVKEYLDCGSYTQVALNHNRNHSTVITAIERYRLNNPEDYNKIRQYYLQKKEEEFVNKTTKVIDKITDKIVEQLDTNDNTLSQMSTTLGILYDKRQLSQGKSTQNSAIVVQMSKDIQELSN